jgi:hypothetical protein
MRRQVRSNPFLSSRDVIGRFRFVAERYLGTYEDMLARRPRAGRFPARRRPW